jgi:hypothetical protein
MICWSMADVEESFADDCDNHRLIELQFPAGSHAKWKFDFRPTKQFGEARTFPALPVSQLQRILKGNGKVVVLFCS